MAALLGLALIACGCVSVDPRAFREKPHAASAKEIVGTYANTARYRSNGEFVASPSLTYALGLPGVRTATSVVVSRPTDLELRIEFRDGSGTLRVLTYVAGTGMSITADGEFEIAVPVGCGGRDSPGFGCGNKTVTLFATTDRDLAAIESGGAAGVLGVIPFAIYSKQLAIYPREDR